MRGIHISEFGGPEVLRLSSVIPKPTPSAKQVLVSVKAAGVNPVDTYLRSGTYARVPLLPYIPGVDGAGVVQQIGDQVNKVKVGDRVWFAGCVTGSTAEYCLCNEDVLGQLPEACSFVEGAMIGSPYMTAYRALFQKGKVEKGETVFIHGATGGVGNAAVQMCKNLGCRIIGTAGSSDGIELLKSIGVDIVYNHRSNGYVDQIKKDGHQIDVIVEMLANVNLQTDLDIISEDGRILIVGNRGSIEIVPRAIMTTECIVTGVKLMKNTPKERAECIEYLNSGLQSGWVKPILWKTLELEQAADAHKEIIENTGAKGQIVLKI